MDFNLVTYLETCKTLISIEPAMTLVYYSHIPTAILSLVVGFFVFFKNRSLISKILLGISVSFSLWTLADFITWTSTDSRMTTTAWSMFGILNVLIFILGLYLVSVFPENKDVSWKWKIFFGLLTLPILLLTPTRYNILNYTAASCEATDGNYFINYYYGISIFIAIFIILLTGIKLRKCPDSHLKKQIILLAIGVELFLFLFGTTGIIASLIDYYRFEFYGLFGMTIFLGLLAYLIVKYKAFEIKMLAAQVLVAGLVILVAAEFFFIPMENTTSVILLSVTVLLATIFGIWLINSVKNEVRRKEELQVMSDSLATANDRLKKLDNAKSEFISIASHQLRTPLTSIKGYISLITEGTYGAVSAEVKDALSRVYLSNERLIKLVENLLNVSRIESGRMEYTWEKGSVENIIMGLLDDFIFAAKKNGLYLNAKMPEAPLPQIRMDKAKLTEVISNTIDNAIKYTKKGGVTVQAELVTSNQKPVTSNENKSLPVTDYGLRVADAIRVTVSDTGIGIPKENMDEMFQKFSRGKDTARLHATGTGLGMFVAKNIIEAHQGRIWVESDGQDKGSRFIIELPVE